MQQARSSGTEKWRLTPLRALALMGVVAVVAGGCSGSTRGPVAIDNATLEGPTVLQINVVSCNGDPEVSQLEEAATEVRVEVVADLDPVGDCQDTVTVELDAPLNGRSVVDLTSGRVVSAFSLGADQSAPEVAPVDDAVDPVGSDGSPSAEQWPVTAVSLTCGTCESAFDIGGIVF